MSQVNEMNNEDFKKSKLYVLCVLSGMEMRMVNGHVGKFAHMSNGKQNLIITEDEMKDEALLINLKNICQANGFDSAKYIAEFNELQNKAVILSILKNDIVERLSNLPTELRKFTGTLLCTDKGLELFNDLYNKYGAEKAKGFNQLLSQENPELAEEVKEALSIAIVANKKRNGVLNQEENFESAQ